MVLCTLSASSHALLATVASVLLNSVCVLKDESRRKLPYSCITKFIL